MSAALLAAQDAARQNNGRFGSQLHGEMAGGTDVLGAPVNLAKEYDNKVAPRALEAESPRIRPGDGGYPLPPSHYGHPISKKPDFAVKVLPHVRPVSAPSVFEYQGGRVTMPALEDIRKVQRGSDGDELVVPVRHEDRYGRSAEREVTVKKHGDGYAIALSEGKEYSDDERTFLTAAASAIAWTCPPEPVEPENAHRTANLAGLSAKHWMGADSTRGTADPAPAPAVPGNLDRAQLAEHQKAHMKTWKETEDFRNRMQRAREAAEDSYKPPGFFASLTGIGLRHR